MDSFWKINRLAIKASTNSHFDTTTTILKRNKFIFETINYLKSRAERQARKNYAATSGNLASGIIFKGQTHLKN